MIRTVILSCLVVAGLMLAVTAPAHALCPGDCNGDGVVTVVELMRSVNLALGYELPRMCPPADLSGDHQVTIDEVLIEVTAALEGCPATVSLHRAPELSAPAGPLSSSQGVLPNGRRVQASGVQVPAETLPLNLALIADGRYLLITNDGHSDEEHRQFLQLLDTQTLALSKVEVPQF